MRTGTSVVALSALVAVLFLQGSVRADTFRIELDYMVDTDHTHLPPQIVVDALVQMFACAGHNLIIELEAIPHFDVLEREPGTLSFFSYDGARSSFGYVKTTYQDHTGPGWHYGVMGHAYQGPDLTTTTSSGVAEFEGDDFLVSLWNHENQVGSNYKQAATIAHEFGHNLGLKHCGDMDCRGVDPSDPSYVGPTIVNIPSVMSYMYQLKGVRANLECQGLVSQDSGHLFRQIDYSHGTMCTLNEGALDEDLGTGISAVDWDCSGSINGVVAQDLNGNNSNFCSNDGNLNVIRDYDEWANIQDFAKFRSKQQLDEAEIIECIPAEDWDPILDKASCPQPVLVVEPCVSAQALYVGAGGTVLGAGTCEDLLNLPSTAFGRATAESVLLLEPGTYDEAGELLWDKELIVKSTGSATIK